MTNTTKGLLTVGRKYSSFTQEDIRILKDNPNTSTVTKSQRISETDSNRVVRIHCLGAIKVMGLK